MTKSVYYTNASNAVNAIPTGLKRINFLYKLQIIKNKHEIQTSGYGDLDFWYFYVGDRQNQQWQLCD